MSMRYIELLFCFVVVSLFGTNVLKSQDFVYDDNIYVDYISSVKLTHNGLATSYPIVDLGSRYQGRLLLTFDDLEGGYKRYTYQIIHCDMYWKPSDQMQEIEYLDGFNFQDVTDYTYSTNGYSDYTHYRLVLPNEDLEWTISGNYLLVIHDEELEVPVITRRFMVAENLININQMIIQPRNVRKNDSHQEMKLSVSYKNFRINQPRYELFATIMQNGNWNSAIIGLEGLHEQGESLVFDNFDRISFPALKEFRNFDIRPINYTTEFVSRIEQNDIETNAYLDPSKPRSNKYFLDEIDANGFFIIENERYDNDHISSEYINVHFTLLQEYPYDRPVYIVGAFSDWQPREKYRMEYDLENQYYKASAYFKQGYYDYMYALLNENGTLDFETIEGNWYETENDYQILIYYREFGSFYDRIIAVKNFNSNTQF